MSDESQKNGRNLSVTSFVVILYTLGGGHFNNTGTLLGGSVTFSRASILEYAGLALLFFYLHLFVLNKGGYFGQHGILYQWRNDRNECLKNSTSLRNHITECGTKAMQAMLESTGKIGGQSFNKGATTYPVNALWDNNLTPPIIRKPFRRSAQVIAVDNNSSQRAWFEVDLSWWYCQSADLHSMLKATLLRVNFFNDIFPILLCAAATLLVALRWFGFL